MQARQKTCIELIACSRCLPAAAACMGACIGILGSEGNFGIVSAEGNGTLSEEFQPRKCCRGGIPPSKIPPPPPRREPSLGRDKADADAVPDAEAAAMASSSSHSEGSGVFRLRVTSSGRELKLGLRECKGRVGYSFLASNPRCQPARETSAVPIIW